MSSTPRAPGRQKTIRINTGGRITALEFLPDCEHVVSGDDFGVVKLWDVAKGVQVGREMRTRGKFSAFFKTAMDVSIEVRDIAVSKDGRWIVGGISDGQVFVWDARTLKEVFKYQAHSECVASVDVSPDSKTFATGGSYGKASIWDISRSGWKWAEMASDIVISRVKFSPDGNRLATVAYFSFEEGGGISIFNAKSGDLLIKISPSAPSSPLAFVDSLSPVAWSVDGQHIFAAQKGDIIQIDASNGSLLSRWQVDPANHPLISSIAYSITSGFMACRSSNPYNPISLWDTSTHTRLGPTIQHSGLIVVLSSDDQFLLAYDGCDIVIQSLRGVVPQSRNPTPAPASLGIKMPSVKESHRNQSDSIIDRSEAAANSYIKAANYHESTNSRSATHSLKSSPELSVNWSRAQASKQSWEDALNHAEQAIALDPSYLPAYECKHAALHGTARYDEAIEAHKMIFSVIQQSSDPTTRELLTRYVHPSKTEATIRRVVQSFIQHLPRVLIDAVSGRLHDKNAQASSFETSTSYKELVSSMTTSIDLPRIEKAVADYYAYVMFSHMWDGTEPLFQMVETISILDLAPSPAFDNVLSIDKLKNFLTLVRKLGFKWLWSDTCCIDKRDPAIMQESLVLMFPWYRGSTLTIVYLRGVIPPSMAGALVNSLWNTRGWTYQEYVAAETVQFYCEDWTPYLGLPIFDENNRLVNHKLIPAIGAEMEQVVRARLGSQAPELRPGRDCIREKLCLASMRKTTRVEDAAYSLFGILATSIDIKYGEGEESLARFLAQVLMSSADVSILAWTGESSTWNSCMPARIIVFKELATTHLPPHLTDNEMDRIVSKLRASNLDLSTALQLYDRLCNLDSPWFAAARMKLPCLTFKLGPLQLLRSRGERVYRARTTALGIVEITTAEDLSQLGTLYLVHPWISSLLDRELVNNNASTDNLQSPLPPPDDEGEPLPLAPLSAITSTSQGSLFGKETQALRVIARLYQPFGALLLASRSNGYRRVASDCLITVQIQENTDFSHLVDKIRVLDVL